MRTLTILLIFLFSFQNSFSQTETTELTAAPNPFSSSTTITIHNLYHDTVSLKVYNMTGAVIVDFFDSLVLSGTIMVPFDASALPDNVYIAILKKNSETIGIKIFKIATAGIASEKTVPFKIYPNPVTEVLSIQSNIPIQHGEIYAMNGKRVKIIEQNENKISLTALKPGTYLLHIKMGNQIYIQRIVKK